MPQNQIHDAAQRGRGAGFAGDRPSTLLFNATGQPAMSVPLGGSKDGLPIGMQFIGRFADEATLLRLATQLEQAKPWANEVPPIL